MSIVTDMFTIGFNSEGLKDFEANLKNNEKELDKYEKEVKNLEKRLEELKNSEKDNIKEIVKTDIALAEAKEKVEQFQKSVDTMKNQSEYQLLKLKKNFQNLVKTVGLLAGAGVAIRKSLEFYEQAEQLDFLAQKTGIATEKLQEFANAAKKYGGTTEGTASSIENIRTNKEEYKKYGIQVSDDPTQTLENVAKKMQTLKNDTQKWDMANALGLDEGTTRLLIQGAERYREELKRTSKYKLYTKEDIERMRQYRQTQQDIRMGIENIFGSISRMLLPGITAAAKAIRAVTDWISEHEGAVKIIATLTGVAVAIGGVIMIIKNLSAVLLFLDKTLLKFLLNPVVLQVMAWAVAITALIVVIQDFITFLQGGDSIIGDILKRMGFNVNEVRQKCLNFFNGIKEGIFGAISWLKSLGGKFSELAQKIKAMWDAIPEPLKKLIGMSNPISGTYTVINTAKQALSSANGNKMNSVPQGAISNYNQTQAINNNNNANAQSINNSKKSTKTTNIDKVIIQTQATDGKGIASELDVISEFDDGILI